MRSKFNFFMRSKFNLFMRSNLSNNIDQEVDTSIMRSKPKIALLAISISWSYLQLTNRSWDWNCLIMHYFNFDLMIEVSTSWSKLSNIYEQIRPHEQIEFWPHDQKFDLLKKLNFDLMKFDLLTLSLNKQYLTDFNSFWPILTVFWPILTVFDQF